jgi:hypothetical protein
VQHLVPLLQLYKQQTIRWLVWVRERKLVCLKEQSLVVTTVCGNKAATTQINQWV